MSKRQPKPRAVPQQAVVPDAAALLSDLQRLIDQARQAAALAVNMALTRLYWRIGQRIHVEVLGKDRAAYGQEILPTLSAELMPRYGRGFSARSLWRMVQFAETFPGEEIVATVWRHVSGRKLLRTADFMRGPSMSPSPRDEAYLRSLVRELVALPAETPWVEWKHNNAKPEEIGEYISALANAAALEGKARAYLLWGVNDASHALVGTDFDPAAVRVGAEELESWLLRLLAPKLNFRFHQAQIDGHRLVLLEIERAVRHPVQFMGTEYLRIGSYKKKLKEFPERERALWRLFDATPYELLPAADHLGADEVLRLLDYPAYFDLLARPLPDGRDALLQALAADELITREDSGHWAVRNLGALLFAKRLADFGHLRRKAVRVVVYTGRGRTGGAQREHESGRGYAAGFEGLISHINGLLPGNEVVGQALRKPV